MMTTTSEHSLESAADTVALPLTTLVLGLLNALFAQCRPGGVGRVLAGRGTSAQAYGVPTGAMASYLPEWLVRELEYVEVDEVRIVPATECDARQQDLGAAFVRVPLNEQALAQLRSFEPFPPIVLDEGVSVMAVWPLELPLRLDEPAGLERALRLQRDLTEHLGGDAADVTVVAPRRTVSVPGQVNTVNVMPAYHPAWPAIVMPGCRGRVRAPDHELVTCAYFTDARVSADALEAALQSGTSSEPQPKGTKR